MNRVLGWFWGYITVLVTGEACERFMNLCGFYSRDVWDFQKNPKGLSVKVRVSEYKNLRHSAKRAGVHLHIESKHGFPFLLRRYRFRYGIFVGFLIFIVLLNVLCGRIWSVEIHGISSLNSLEVMTMLQSVGISEGVKKDAYDWATVRQKIMEQNPQISWMSFNPIGTVLFVDISETAKAPGILDHNVPCNLKATKDGVILSAKVYAGQPLVKPGDAVVKGDILVSGAVEYKNGCTVFRHASAEIVAQTKYHITFKIPLRQTVQCRTGQSQVRHVIRFFGMRIPMYLGSIKEQYETVPTSHDMQINHKTLPLGVDSTIFYYTSEKQVTLSEHQALSQAQKKLNEYKINELDDVVIKTITTNHTIDKQTLTFTADFLCEENICFEENMLIF